MRCETEIVRRRTGLFTQVNWNVNRRWGQENRAWGKHGGPVVPVSSVGGPVVPVSSVGGPVVPVSSVGAPVSSAGGPCSSCKFCRGPCSSCKFCRGPCSSCKFCRMLWLSKQHRGFHCYGTVVWINVCGMLEDNIKLDSRKLGWLSGGILDPGVVSLPSCALRIWKSLPTPAT
jgi:hypothetical protein